MCETDRQTGRIATELL